MQETPKIAHFSILNIKYYEIYDSRCCWSEYEDSNAKQECNEVLVITMTKAVIDINAMMIKFFYTLAANHAVKSFIWFYYLTVETEVF